MNILFDSNKVGREDKVLSLTQSIIQTRKTKLRSLIDSSNIVPDSTQRIRFGLLVDSSTLYSPELLIAGLIYYTSLKANEY